MTFAIRRDTRPEKSTGFEKPDDASSTVGQQDARGISVAVVSGYNGTSVSAERDRPRGPAWEPCQ